MIRASLLSTALLSAALWMSSLSASARADAFVPAVHRAQVPILWAGAIYTGGDNGEKHGGDGDKHWGNGGNGNGYDNGGNGKGNHDGDGDRDDRKGQGGQDGHAPTPAPEPSTVLSFGAALLVGGGVFYSRRLRRKGN
jgi:hypothetical protein